MFLGYDSKSKRNKSKNKQVEHINQKDFAQQRKLSTKQNLREYLNEMRENIGYFALDNANELIYDGVKMLVQSKK